MTVATVELHRWSVVNGGYTLAQNAQPKFVSRIPTYLTIPTYISFFKNTKIIKTYDVTRKPIKLYKKSLYIYTALTLYPGARLCDW